MLVPLDELLYKVPAPVSLVEDDHGAVYMIASLCKRLAQIAERL